MFVLDSDSCSLKMTSDVCEIQTHVLITGLCVCVRVGSGASPGGVIEKTRGAGEKSRRAGPQGERDAVSERIGR